jgi:hypothetical protein
LTLYLLNWSEASHDGNVTAGRIHFMPAHDLMRKERNRGTTVSVM